MGDFVNCFGQVGVDQINLMMTDLRHNLALQVSYNFKQYFCNQT